MGWTVDTPHGQLYAPYRSTLGWRGQVYTAQCTLGSARASLAQPAYDWALAAPEPVLENLPTATLACTVHRVTWHQEHGNLGSNTLFTVFTFRGDFNAGQGNNL